MRYCIWAICPAVGTPVQPAMSRWRLPLVRSRLGATVLAVKNLSAAEDLQLLLDVQELKGRPFGGLLFSCNGRGKRLFEEPNHDLRIINERLGSIPVAGFFAAAGRWLVVEFVPKSDSQVQRLLADTEQRQQSAEAQLTALYEDRITLYREVDLSSVLKLFMKTTGRLTLRLFL